jgi:hypothetical protein
MKKRRTLGQGHTSILMKQTTSISSMKRKGFLAQFSPIASLGEISSRLIWQDIQKQQISFVMIVASNVKGNTS